MASVEKIGISTVNFCGNDYNSKEEKTHNLKENITPAKVTLGALATLGVLGMADILIFKGRHINKLTGTGKDLEAALGRATSAETRAASAETRATGLEAKLQEVTESNAKSLETMKQKLEEMKKELNNFQEGMSADDIKITTLRSLSKWHNTVSDFGKEAETYLRKEFRKLLNKLHCDYVEELTPEFRDCFEIEKANIGYISYSNPAIIDKKTNQVLVKGQAFVPLNYEM
jgi:hypothetical protein